MDKNLNMLEHQHDDKCGHGHEHEHTQKNHETDHHEEQCGCGHEHGHEHTQKNQKTDHHEEQCGCGHDHGHEHTQKNHETDHHEEQCGCGHVHRSASKKNVFTIENLGCANCAAKMERKIAELPGVEDAVITFATKQLRLAGVDGEALLPQIQEICCSIEPDVKVVPRNRTKGNAGLQKAGESLKNIFMLENLGCANCAAKMESKIAELPGVADVAITFSTKQLRLYAADGAALLPQIQDICQSIEPDVNVVFRNPVQKQVKEEKTAKQETARKEKSEQKKAGIQIVIGAILFLTALVLEKIGFGVVVTLPLNIIAYIILGSKVVLTAKKNLGKGQIFDENFLMSIATIGAFAIQEYPEAVGVMLFYRVGEYFEHRAVEKSRSQIMDAVDMRPEVVNLVAGDEVQVIASEEATVGDILLVRPGDRIPLDGTVVDGESRIDTSPITGEPVPVKAEPGNEVISGCVNTSGQLKIRVDRPLEESMVTRILDSVENAAASKPKMEKFITKFSRIYTPIVVILALGTAVIPSLFTGNWNYWIYTALSFLVMSCPCALVLSVPLAFFSGIGAGSKKGILFKGGVALESLSAVDAVVMDKTGTITEGNFVLQKVVKVGALSEEKLLQICASCEQNSTHPIGTSIVAAAKGKNIKLEKPSSLEEIAGYGIKANLLGSEVLCGNQKLMEKFQVSLKDYKNDAYGAEVLIAIDGKYAGYVLISDTIKKDAKEAVRRLKNLNIATVMLTGDAVASAEAVAKSTGIDEVHAKLLPEDKLTELQKVRSKRGAVMFVGDGINDAPVLAGADVGAAMGSGADAAIEAADVVFMTSSMEAIPQSISIAKQSSSISKQNVIFALVIKVVVMILGLCGFASMWAAVFADTGVAMLCVLNSIRILYKK